MNRSVWDHWDEDEARTNWLRSPQEVEDSVTYCMASGTEPDVTHYIVVQANPDRVLSCTCKGFEFRHECRHAREALDKFVREGVRGRFKVRSY